MFIWLFWVFMAVQAFSSCGKWGLGFVAMLRLLIAITSPVAQHGLQVCGLQESQLVGSRAQCFTADTGLFYHLRKFCLGCL